MILNVAAQEIKGRRNGFECVHTSIFALVVYEEREEADIGAHIENTIAIIERDAMPGISPILENLLIDLARFALVEVEHLQLIWQLVERLANHIGHQAFVVQLIFPGKNDTLRYDWMTAKSCLYLP